jgi:hypothetical protein
MMQYWAIEPKQTCLAKHTLNQLELEYELPIIGNPSVAHKLCVCVCVCVCGLGLRC